MNSLEIKNNSWPPRSRLRFSILFLFSWSVYFAGFLHNQSSFYNNQIFRLGVVIYVRDWYQAEEYSKRQCKSHFKHTYLPSLDLWRAERRLDLARSGPRHLLMGRTALEANIKLVNNLPKIQIHFTSFNKWFDKCFNWFSVNDLQAPQHWGSHVSAYDRKIAAAYFTVIFEAVIKGNPIPYWPALVTSGTHPRFCPIFVAITTQSRVWLKLYLLGFTVLLNKYLFISWYVKKSIGGLKLLSV